MDTNDIHIASADSKSSIEAGQFEGTSERVIGKLAFHCLRSEVAPMLDDDPFTGCFFILSGFSPGQIAEFVAVSNLYKNVSDKLHIELPRQTFGTLVDDSLLVDHSAVETRNSRPYGKITLAVDLEADVETSVNHKETIAATSLKAREDASRLWFEVVAAEINATFDIERRKQIEAMIRGLFDAGYFGIESAAEYIQEVMRGVEDGTLLVTAAGLKLPLLGLPLYEDCFKPLVDKKLGQPSQWRDRFELHQKNASYLSRRHSSGLLLAPEDLLKTYDKLRDAGANGDSTISEEQLEAFGEYAKAAPSEMAPAKKLLFDYDWSTIRKFFEKPSKKSPVRKFVDDTRKALEFKGTPASASDDAILVELESKSSRKSGEASDDEQAFYESHEDAILAFSPKLAAEWQDYVYEKKAVCTDFFAGLFDCIRRHISALTPGYECRLLIEGVRQHRPLDFTGHDPRACEYFERHYAKLPTITNNLVTFAGPGTGRRETLLPNYRQAVKELVKSASGKKKSGKAKVIEFRISILQRPPGGSASTEAQVASIPLTWKFPVESVPANEHADLAAIIKHASKPKKSALVRGEAYYAAVGKKGMPLTISLDDTSGFAPSKGDGSFVPSPSKITNIDTEIVAIVDKAVADEILTSADRAVIVDSIDDFAVKLEPALQAYHESALQLDHIPPMVEAYRVLHAKIAGVKHEFTRKRILQELWNFGCVTVEEANHRPALSIICSWHPLRLEAHRARVLQLSQRLSLALQPRDGQFSDDRKGSLFFRDIRELCESQLHPDLTLLTQGAEAKLMLLGSHLGNYSIHKSAENQNVMAAVQAVEDNSAEAARTILSEVDEYLRLQPHERDNLAILLYNCESRELPARLVSEFNKRNRDPKREKVNCEILLTHRNERHLQEIYQELVTDTADGNGKSDERDGDFLSRVRINISASSAVSPKRRTIRGKPTDIAYCRDLLSKEAKLLWQWTEKGGNTLDAVELIPHQWQRMLPFKEGKRVAEIFLTSPAQTAAGWSYLRNLGFLCDQLSEKAWENDHQALPVRSLNFDTQDVDQIITETHKLGVWVVNQDELLDRRLLEDRKVRVIRYVQSTSMGRNLVISSTARDTLLVNTIRELLKQLLPAATSTEEIDLIVQRFMTEANVISGGLILRAARRANNTKELMGVVLSKYLIETQIGSDPKDCWFMLDDYCHWLGKRDGAGLADLLILSPTERDGRPHLDIVVSEAKFITPDTVGPAKTKSESQLRDTLVQIARALSADSMPLDQDLWLSRLADMLMSRSIKPSLGGGRSPEQWRSIIRNRKCTFSITGYSHVFVHKPDDSITSACKGIETKQDDLSAYQELFGCESTQNLVLQMHGNKVEDTKKLRTQLGHPFFAPLTARDLSIKPEDGGSLTSCDHSDASAHPSEDTDGVGGNAGADPVTMNPKNHSPKTTPDKTTIHEIGVVPPVVPSHYGSGADPILTFLCQRSDHHASVASDGEEWLNKTVASLKTALHSRGMSAKLADGKPPTLTPNAALIRLQGGTDLTLKQIENRAEELYTTDGLKILSLLPGEKMISVSVARPDRQTLHSTTVFANLLASPDANDDELVFVGIKEEDGAPLFLDPFSNPHTLVAGATGSGKSVLVQNMLLHIALTRSPDQSQIYLIDGKSGVDYLPLRHLPHIRAGSGDIVDSKEGSAEILAELVQEMERRYALFKEAEAKNIRHYRSKTGNYLPTIWVIHDEFAEWMEDKDYAQAVESYVNRLSIKSRAAGIFMMFCAQRPDNTVMPMQLRSQLSNRLVLKVADPGTAEIATGEKNSRAEQLLKHGHMIAKLDSHKTYVQVPLIDTDEEMEPLVSLLNQRYLSPPESLVIKSQEIAEIAP